MPFVYLIGEMDNENNYKIGVTNELQTGNSQPLYVKSYFETKYPYKLEKMLHRHYQDKHILNEWFYLDKIDVEKFNETCEKYNNILLSLKDNPFC